MIKEIINLVNVIVGRLFDKSINKKNQETDFNMKTLNMMKEYNLASIIKNHVEERQIKLLTGKNVSIRFAEKIQKLKIKLGGNTTDEDLYSIISYYKEDENGDLFVDISNMKIFSIRFLAILILIVFIFLVLCLSYIFNNIQNLTELLYYIFILLIFALGSVLFLNLISTDFIAIHIKKKLERLV